MPSTKTYNVIVVGYKEQGKSATVRKLSGDQKYKGKDNKTARKTFRLNESCCLYESSQLNESSQLKELSSCTVHVLDTPGLGSLDTDDHETLDRISKDARCLEHVDAILIVFKMGRITVSQMKAVDHFRNIFGPNFLQKSIIVLTFADVIKAQNITIGECIVDSPEPFQSILNECGERILCVENSDWEDQKEKQEELLKLVKSIESVHYEVPDAESAKSCSIWRRIFEVFCCGKTRVCIAVFVAIAVVVVVVAVAVPLGVTNSSSGTSPK